MATIYDVISGPDPGQVFRSIKKDEKRLDQNYRKVVFFLKKPTDVGSRVVRTEILNLDQEGDNLNIIARATTGFKIKSRLKIRYNTKTRKGTAALMDA